MKKTLIVLLAIMSFGLQAQSIYDFEVKDIDGKPFNLSSLKGKRVMIVNVASKCGLTPQYEQLQEVYTKYGSPTFEIIGFPANNFLRQEPGTNMEIKEFCTSKFGVNFLMMEKISVKGKSIHPLYSYLTTSTDSKVKWNFQKYLINEDGSIAGVISPKEKPDSERIIKWITTGVLEKK